MFVIHTFLKFTVTLEEEKKKKITSKGLRRSNDIIVQATIIKPGSTVM